MENKEKKAPNPLISALPLLTLVALIVLILVYFPDDALSGASQLALIFATAVCVAISMIVYKVSWSSFE